MQYPPPPPPDNQQQGYGNPYGAPPPPPGSPMYPPPPPGGANYGGGGFGGGMGGGGDDPKGKTAIGMEANVASLISYLSLFCCFIIPLVFFFMEKENKFFRFHSIQAVLLSVAYLVIIGVLWVIATVFASIGGIASILGIVLYLGITVVGLAYLAGLIFGAIKAYQGERLKLPLIGDVAENMSNK